MTLPPRRKKVTKKGRYDPCFRNRDHLNWVKTYFGCCVVGCKNVDDKIDPMHITGVGGATIGRKPPDDRVVPGCRTHHEILDHQLNEVEFQRRFNVDFESMILDINKASPVLSKLRRDGLYPLSCSTI